MPSNRITKVSELWDFKNDVVVRSPLQKFGLTALNIEISKSDEDLESFRCFVDSVTQYLSKGPLVSGSSTKLRRLKLFEGQSVGLGFSRVLLGLAIITDTAIEESETSIPA